MITPGHTYRCEHCTQLLPFDAHGRVPAACLRRCQGGCEWTWVGPTEPAVRARAEADGEVDADGLPRSVASTQEPLDAHPGERRPRGRPAGG